MRESNESINLMKLNCERINIINTDPYLVGKRCMNQSKRDKIKMALSQGKGIINLIKRKIQYEYYKRNSKKIIDFTVPFTERNIKDFLIDDYRDVGKGVVYTAVFGGYDHIDEPMFVNPNLDYVAFTDAELPENSIWKKFDLTKFSHLNDLDSYHLAKYIKMFPYEFFSEYDFSIWVDGNVNLIADTYPIAIMANGSPMATFANPIHDCIYTESEYMIFQGRVDKADANRQMSEYRSLGFPEHFGMREFSIIYREHSNSECYRMMKIWWEHVNKYTMRDQLSLPFILWENGKTIDYIKCLGQNWRWNPRFKQLEHNYQIMYNKTREG